MNKTFYLIRNKDYILDMNIYNKPVSMMLFLFNFRFINYKLELVHIKYFTFREDS